MLKTIGLYDVLGPKVGNGNNEVVRFGIDGGGEEHATKSGKLSKGLKLSKSGNSKRKKSAKSKKPSKTGNSPTFDANNAGPNFLTSQTRAAFNCLQLAFTKAPIFWHFDPEYYIWIKTDILSYAIGDVLSQLASRTRPDREVTKTDLG